MAQWRKVLVSGSSADVSSLNVGTLDGTSGTIINNSSIAGSRITGSFTGSFVGDGSNLTGVSATSLDIDAFGSDLTSATLAVSDLLIVSDGGTDGRANIGDLATPLAGTGLEADSNTIRIAAAAAGDGLSGGAGSALALDLNELSAAAVNVAADSIAIIDADDNSSKKESVADFVDAINGTGIDAGSGQLSITAAQTGITSVKNNALVIGGNSQNNTIDFGTDDVILFDTDNTERMRVDAGGVDVTGALTVSTNATIEGNLVVNGDTTTLSTTNLAVGDQFIFTATGSAGTNVDSGLIIQSGSAVDSGSALYHDKNDQRWAVAKGISSITTAVTPLEHVVTVKSLGDNDAPVDGDKEYGVGEIAINSDGTIWIYS